MDAQSASSKEPIVNQVINLATRAVLIWMSPEGADDLGCDPQVRLVFLAVPLALLDIADLDSDLSMIEKSRIPDVAKYDHERTV